MFFIPSLGLTETWHVFILRFQDLLGLTSANCLWNLSFRTGMVTDISHRLLIFMSSVLDCPRQSDLWVSHKAFVYFLEFNSPFICSTVNSLPPLPRKNSPINKGGGKGEQSFMFPAVRCLSTMITGISYHFFLILIIVSVLWGFGCKWFEFWFWDCMVWVSARAVEEILSYKIIKAL